MQRRSISRNADDGIRRFDGAWLSAVFRSAYDVYYQSTIHHSGQLRIGRLAPLDRCLHNDQFSFHLFGAIAKGQALSRTPDPRS